MRTGKFHSSRMKGVNPYAKYLSKEDILQHQVITWCRLNKIRFHHSPDSGRRSAFEQFKYSYLGSDAGYLDLTFFELRLIIELKVKPNRLTPAQKEWLEYFKGIGWRAEVCWTFTEAIALIAGTRLEQTLAKSGIKIQP